MNIKWFTIFLLFLFLESNINATNFYISPNGNDTATGKASAKAWRSIEKLNASMKLLKAGDSILFQRNGTYFGTIVITESGKRGKPIVIADYGKGSKPLISGTIKATNWSLVRDKIWECELPSYKNDRICNLFVNGHNIPIGRYPDILEKRGGYLEIESHSGDSIIISKEIATIPDFSGSEIVVRNQRWILDRLPIKQITSNTIWLNGRTTYKIRDQFGFFFQNHPNCLNIEGEWCWYNNKLMIYSSINPDSLNIEVSYFKSTFFLSNQKYITIKNIVFKGAQTTGVLIDSCQYIQLLDNEIIDQGTNAVEINSSKFIVFDRNIIDNTNNNGLFLTKCNVCQIEKNIIRRTGLVPGMGKGGNNQYLAMQTKGQNIVVQNNFIDSTGYIGIYFNGDSIIIKNNLIDHSCLVKDDGGAIYSGSDGSKINFIRKVVGNIILHSVGNGFGTGSDESHMAHGIYMDDRTGNVEIVGNTVAFCNDKGLILHNAKNIKIFENLIFGNNTQFSIKHEDLRENAYVVNCEIEKNIFFSKYKKQVVMDIYTRGSSIDTLGNFDKNYYCRPFDTSRIIVRIYKPNRRVNNFFNLREWQNAHGQDMKSNQAPFNYGNDSVLNNQLYADSLIRFEYNYSEIPKKISLDDVWFDVAGVKKKGSVTIAPYSSVILMRKPE